MSAVTRLMEKHDHQAELQAEFSKLIRLAAALPEVLRKIGWALDILQDVDLSQQMDTAEAEIRDAIAILDEAEKMLKGGGGVG
jgi:hypothetical protein